jgi:hypothetical protein
MPTPEHWKHSKDWTEIGTVGVDAGQVWIGDPCYLAPDDRVSPNAPSPSKDWDQFVDWFNTPYRQSAQHPLGVVARSGYGDGSYKVYAKYYDGRVAELRIEFIDCTTGDVAFDWG